MPSDTGPGAPLFEADSALIYLTASQLPNLLLSDNVGMIPVSRHSSRLATRALDGRNTLAFARPASAASIRALIPDARDDEVIAIRVEKPLRLSGAKRLSDDMVELPPLVSITHASTVLYRSPEQASQIRTNLTLSGTDAGRLEHLVSPGTFEGEVKLSHSQESRLSDTLQPSVEEQIRFYERIMGALLAGPASEGWLDPSHPYLQTLATLGGGAWAKVHPLLAATELKLHGIETSEAYAGALLQAIGISGPSAMHPWRGDVNVSSSDADARVAEASYRTLFSQDESITPARSLLEATVRAAEDVDASHGTGLIDRYQRAADLLQSVNTNKRRLDQVVALPTWRQGFHAMQALLLLGVAKDDEYERVWARSDSEDVTPRARVLARSLFGVAFGIRAIPQQFRPSGAERRIIHELVARLTNHVLEQEPMSIVTELGAKGRGIKRVFHFSVEMPGLNKQVETTAAGRKAAEIVSRISILSPQSWRSFVNQVKRNSSLSEHIHYGWARPTGVRVVNDGHRWMGGPDDDRCLSPEPFVPNWDAFAQEVFRFLSSADAREISNWKRALDSVDVEVA